MSLSCSPYFFHAHAIFGFLEVIMKHLSKLSTSRNWFEQVLILNGHRFYSSKKGVSVYWINDPLWCNMVQVYKGCPNEVIIVSLQDVIKRPLTGNIPVI